MTYLSQWTIRQEGGLAFPRAASEDTSGGTLQDGNSVEAAQTGITFQDLLFAKILQAAVISPATDDWADDQIIDYALELAELAIKRRDEARARREHRRVLVNAQDLGDD